jgi:hypothetical protein
VSSIGGDPEPTLVVEGEVVRHRQRAHVGTPLVVSAVARVLGIAPEDEDLPSEARARVVAAVLDDLEDMPELVRGPGIGLVHL